jgi:ADP-ribose pyrophosphatase
MPSRKTNKIAKPARKKARLAPKKTAARQAGSKAVAAKSTASTPKKAKAEKPKKAAKAVLAREAPEKAELLSSEVVYEGPLFKVQHDKLIEPTGLHTERDVIRHNGSVVILAVDRSGSKKNPWIVMERQYRHAANQFLWELPAGKLEAGEDPLAGAKRELAEETGYQAKSWKPLVQYWPSPGFLGEPMLVFLAEGLYVYTGEAKPDEDERIEMRLVKLSDILKMIEKGAIHDGKTLNAVLLYAWLHGRKRKKG